MESHEVLNYIYQNYIPSYTSISSYLSSYVSLIPPLKSGIFIISSVTFISVLLIFLSTKKKINIKDFEAIRLRAIEYDLGALSSSLKILSDKYENSIKDIKNDTKQIGFRLNMQNAEQENSIKKLQDSIGEILENIIRIEDDLLEDEVSD